MGTNGDRHHNGSLIETVCSRDSGNSPEPIAIVGMGCRFPGAANLEEYWALLRNGGDAIREVPPERWDINELFNPDPSIPGKIGSRFGGFLEKLDEFDAAFFGISPREAPHVDPRQRVVLEVAWEALEDAGIAPDSLSGSKTGVFVSTLTSDYDQILSRDTSLFQIYSGVGTANSIIANRVSYFLDLRGPSISLDTACSGSLVSIDLACKSLRTGESTLALAGGVAINLVPNGDIFFSRAGSLSPDGRCHTFDSNANGIVRSEGAGLIVLKRLSDALEAGDRIYAVIRGSAVNHDGRSNGIMAPNGEAQESVLREAYRAAGVAAGKVQYIEAHGTGTLVGDPIEVRALMNVLGVDRQPGFPCVLGSVKTNIGHTESAAGVAGVIKVALALRHRLIPPNLHLRALNPLIAASEFPVTVYQAPGAWPSPDEPLIAGVSGFGFGGTNAHVVLQEFAASDSPSVKTALPSVLPLSAKSEEALREIARSYRAFLKTDHPEVSFQDICYTASVRRSHHENRLALTVQSAEEAVEQLNTILEGEEPPPGVASSNRSRTDRPRIAFMFSGQGSPYAGMGKRLFEEEAVFRDAMQACDEIFRRHAGWSLLEQIQAGTSNPQLGLAESTQPVIFAFQVSLAALWRSWGVEPDAIVGQSLGEVAAAHVAGALTLDDAVRLVFHRSRLLDSVVGKGKTAVVGMRPDDIHGILEEFNGLVALAGNTGPASSVISGDSSAVEQVVALLKSRDVFCRLLENVDAAVHSFQMDPLVGPLTEALDGLSPRPTSTSFISTVTASEIAGEELTSYYWGRNLREPFRFWDAAKSLIEDGCDTFVEMSYHPVLTGAIRQGFVHLGREGVALGSLQRDKDERWAMLSSLGAIYIQGYPVDWRRHYPNGGRHVSLPRYPWQRERYWFDQLKGTSGSGGLRNEQRKAGVHPLLGTHMTSALPSGDHFYELDLAPNTIHYLSGHAVQGAVLLPGSAYVEMALAAAEHAYKALRADLEDIEFQRALILSDDEVRRVQLVLSPVSKNLAAFQVFSRVVSSAGVQESWTLHTTGKIHLRTDDHADASRSTMFPEQIKARCTDQMSDADHYLAMQTRGIEYGPSFQAVRHVWSRYGEALTRLEAPRVCESEIRAYHIHPVILDAAFQGVAATLPPTEGDTYLPEAIRRIRFHEPIAACLWCNVRLSDGAQPGDQRLTADLSLLDDDGRILAEVEGLTLRRLDAAQQKQSKDPDELTYTIEWRPKVCETAGVEVGDTQRLWVVFIDAAGVGLRLVSALESSGARCVVVRSSDHFESSSDKRDWWLRPECPEDFGRLFDALREIAPSERHSIVHLWGIDGSLTRDASRKALERDLSVGCRAVVNIVQKLAQTESPIESRLWVITRGAQPISGHVDSSNIIHATLWGLGRVIGREHPEFWGGLADLDSTDSIEESAALVVDFCRGSDDDQVAFRAGQRYVPRLVRAPKRDRFLRSVRFRPDASYLITGGLSGLGLETARWMAEQGARRLILLSRATLPPRSDWNTFGENDPAGQRVAVIRQLEMSGVSVHAAAVDVADENQLSAFFDQYRRDGYPPIRGVVHSAGLIQDQLLMKMDVDAFERVLRPKLHGAWLLHRLTCDTALDFFVMFSSLSSLLGQFGQANYAAGNAFMDALAHYRQTYGMPALSINWGPWAEVGIFSRLGAIDDGRFPGVQAISPGEGISTLARLLQTDMAQAVVLDADWRSVVPIPMISELAGQETDLAVAADGDQSDKVSMLELLLADPVERKAIIESHLKETVGKILRLDPERLKVTKPLTTLGMDSIMAVELKNKIEASLNLTLSLVDLFTGSVSKLAERLASQLETDEKIGEVLDEVERLPLEQLQAYFQQAEHPADSSDVVDDGAGGD